MRWLKSLNLQTRFKEPLSAHTTMGVGGPADVWVRPRDLKELKEIVGRCVREGLSYFVIGRGSNILFGDKGFRGMVICLNSPSFTKMELDGRRLSCGAGLALNKLIKQLQKKGLAGFEFLAGIPASIGGALVMNAGNRRKAIGDLVKSVTVMDKQGNICLLNKRELRFGYRRSNLDRYIVLGAQFLLHPASPQKIERDLAANLSRKRKTQDLTSRSAGCIFKNPAHRLSAGQMLEACGLKGMHKGGAEISTKHANYIINRSGAKAGDILYLIDLAQKQVKKRFGVHLEPEIKIIK